MANELTKSRLKEALANAEHSPVDKTTQVKAFLASQSGYLGIYSAKGSRDGLKRLDEQLSSKGSLESPAQPLENAYAGCGFSSPVLKPRNENSMPVSASPYVERRPDGNSQEISVRLSEETRESKFYGGVPKSKLPAQMHEANRGVQKKVHKNGCRAKEKLAYEKLSVLDRQGKMKRRCASSDSERSEILAQRRKRRRLKRAKMQELEDDRFRPSDAKSRKSKAEQSKSERNSKDSRNLPAGLALMHGFSAQNVGKHRITLDPPAFIGVFNKGRASGKQKVVAKKKKGATLFNELTFLDNTVSSKKSPIAQDRSHMSKSSVSCLTQSGSGLSVPDDGSAASSQSSHQLQQRSARQTEHRSPSAKSIQSDDRIGEKSEVWEIEKEFLELNTAKAPDEGTSIGKPESILIDWSENSGNERLNGPQSMTRHTPRGIRITGSVASRQRNSTLSSIGPSQSASQVHPILSPVFVTSKHFPTSNVFEKEAIKTPEKLAPSLKGSEVNEEWDVFERVPGVLEVDKPSPVKTPKSYDVNEDSNRSVKWDQSSDGFQSLEDAINKLEQEEINTVLRFCDDIDRIHMPPFYDAAKSVHIEPRGSDADETHLVYADEETWLTAAEAEGPVVHLSEPSFGGLVGLEGMINGLLCEDSAPDVFRLGDAQRNNYFRGAEDVSESGELFLYGCGSLQDAGFIYDTEVERMNEIAYESGAIFDDPSELCLASDTSDYDYSSSLLLDEISYFESDTPFEDRGTTDLLLEFEPANVLADAEAAVAATFRDRWYPLKH